MHIRVVGMVKKSLTVVAQRVERSTAEIERQNRRQNRRQKPPFHSRGGSLVPSVVQIGYLCALTIKFDVDVTAVVECGEVERMGSLLDILVLREVDILVPLESAKCGESNRTAFVYFLSD